ncbi:hypothetical protein Q8F55_008819 [Vanrija albida]|uniref:Dynactin 2 n=1 Tax=Vanrija albida TaxID=181172 RepID=A0ABR3PRW7_9TREE
MSGKYSGMPDIDSAPDVFETTDEADVALQDDGDGVDDARVAAPASDPSDIDVSGLPSRKTAGQTYTFETPDAELTLDRPPRKESHLARLRRLQSEIAELERDLQSSSGTTAESTSSAPARKSVLPPREPVDVVAELATVRERLSVVTQGKDDVSRVSTTRSKDWEGRIRNLDRGIPEPKQDDEKASEPSAPSTSSHRAGDIEARIATLEKVVGSDQNDETLPISIADSLARLDHLLAILTQPRHLDSISRRVKLLLVDLDRASASSRRVGLAAGSERPATATTGLSPTDQEALQRLFTLLPRLDPLIPSIPPLLNRLRSLSSLHAESFGIAADLRQLQASDKSVSEEERSLQSIVSGVQKGLSEASGSIAKNWESLNSRLQALEDRLQAIV